MDTIDTKKLLRSLLSQRDKRTKISQVREVFDEIEIALSSGISYSNVVKKLNESGINISFNTFKSSLQVIRKERRCGKQPSKMQVEENQNENSSHGQTKSVVEDTNTERTVPKSISEIKTQPINESELIREFKELKKGEKKCAPKSQF